jgi:formate hydrogenlyase subunit 4
MRGSLSGRCLGIVFVVCVLAVFFFPLAQGPFQATHGPTTTFRAKWAVLVLLFITVAAAFQVLAALIRSKRSVGVTWIDQIPNQDFHFLKQSAILRC